MSRLTKKILKDELDDFDYDHYKTIDEDMEDACMYKLGQLEDIEEMIEKIYKQPIYVNCGLDIFKFDYTDANILYNFKNNTIEIYEIIVPYVRNFLGEYKVEDYCKIWAFTEEELEK